MTTVTATTQDWFDLLPDYVRRGDVGHDTLRQYLSLVGDQMDPVVAITALLAAGALTDGDDCPVEWLEAACQALGVVVRPGWTEATVRGHMNDLDTYYAHGSPRAIRQAVLDLFPDALDTAVVRHWRGDVWTIVVGTSPSETPLVGEPITTMGEFGDTWPTFTDMEADCATMDDIWDTDRIHVDVAAAARWEEPAGAKVYHLWKTAVIAVLTPVSGVGVAPTDFVYGVGAPA